MTELMVIADHPLTRLLGALVAYLYIFWVVYIAVMGVYRAHLSGRLHGFVRWLAYPIVGIGFVMDVLAQYTIASVFFADMPRRGEHLVTTRLQRYIKQPGTWRYKKAKWVCDTLLDVFDPNGEHC